MNLETMVPNVTEIDKLLLKHTNNIHKAILEVQQKPTYQTMDISMQISFVQLAIYSKVCEIVKDSLKLLKEPA